MAREMTAEDARERCQRTAREAYRMWRKFGGAVALAYEPIRGEVKVSGGNEADPTADIALDQRRARVRRALPEASDMIRVAEAAILRAHKIIDNADRLDGEAVGRTWNTRTAEAAEHRSTARRHQRRRARR